MKRSTQLAFALGLVGLLSAASAFGTASLAVTNAAAMNGTTWGLAVTLDGVAGGPAYVQDASSNNEGTYRALFWLQPNTLTADASQHSHTIFSIHNPGGGVALVRLDLYRLSGGTMRVRAACRQDDGTYQRTTLITLGPAGAEPDRELQLEWGSGAGTGFCRLTRFGGANPSVEVTGLDNDTLSVKRARLGATFSIDANVTGTYWLDEFRSFR